MDGFKIQPDVWSWKLAVRSHPRPNLSPCHPGFVVKIDCVPRSVRGWSRPWLCAGSVQWSSLTRGTCPGRDNTWAGTRGQGSGHSEANITPWDNLVLNIECTLFQLSAPQHNTIVFVTCHPEEDSIDLIMIIIPSNIVKGIIVKLIKNLEHIRVEVLSFIFTEDRTKHFGNNIWIFLDFEFSTFFLCSKIWHCKSQLKQWKNTNDAHVLEGCLF